MAFPDLDPNHVFRDFTTFGVPASGKWDPRKVEIRRLLKSYESAIIALIGGQGGDIDLARGVIYFSVTGGTANDIIAEPDAELPENPGSTVYIIGGIAQDNTGPVTINGKPLLTNSGNQLAAGGLVAGGIYMFLDDGGRYRLLSDYSSSSIQAAAEAAAERSEDAAAAAASVSTEFPRVATVGGLKALDTGKLNAHLYEPGRAGFFKWDATVPVAAHQADVNEFNFIAPNPAADGAWVRVREGNGLDRASDRRLPVGPITLPPTFNDQLGVRLYSDGQRVSYQINPYDILDMAMVGATEYFVNFVSGNNANDGLTSGTAWKTVTYAAANAVAPAIINIEDEIVGFISKIVTPETVLNGNIKIRSASPSGRTIFAAMREDRPVGSFAWTASGGGAYVSTVANTAGFFRAQFDAKYRDEKGIPAPIVAAVSIAACQATPGTYFWEADSSALYVHMLDGRVPDPADGWLYTNAGYRHEWRQSVEGGTLLIENCDFLSNSGSVANANFRYRPVVAGSSEAPSASRIGLRNCRAYGGAGNQFEIYDAAVAVLDNCHGKWSRKDIFNYHSFRAIDTRGEYMTIYEHDCSGSIAGFDGFANQPALSTSENISTAHDSMHILRTNTVAAMCRGAAIADVNGVHSLNYNVSAGDPGAAAIPKACFWHEKYQAAGSIRIMYLWGCSAHDGTDPDTKLISNEPQSGGSANDGDIRIAHWMGQTDGLVRGRLKDWNGMPL